jgi:hypothetical protein
MTNSTPTRLLFRKKITAVFADGSSKISRHCDRGPDAPGGRQRARRSGGRRGSAGTTGRTGPKHRADRRTGLRGDISNVTRQATGQGATGCPSRPNRALSTTFFKGSIAGQINSVFKTREITPLKVSDYKQALADGACTLGNVPLSKTLVVKLQTLGIEVPPTAD